MGLADYFPRHAWAAVLVLATVAVLAFFVPPSATAAVGLTGVGHLAAVAAVEFATAIGIGVIVIYYRKPPDEESDSEWRFDP